MKYFELKNRIVLNELELQALKVWIETKKCPNPIMRCKKHFAIFGLKSDDYYYFCSEEIIKTSNLKIEIDCFK